MSAGALATSVAMASAGMVLTVQYRQHVGSYIVNLGVLLFYKIQDMIQIVNTYLIIFKIIQHVKS